MATYRLGYKTGWIEAFVNGVFAGRFESERQMEEHLFPICEFNNSPEHKSKDWSIVSITANLPINEFIFVSTVLNQRRIIRITYKEATGLFDRDSNPIYYGERYMNERNTPVIILKNKNKRPEAALLSNLSHRESLFSGTTRNFRKIKNNDENQM